MASEDKLVLLIMNMQDVKNKGDGGSSSYDEMKNDFAEMVATFPKDYLLDSGATIWTIVIGNKLGAEISRDAKNEILRRKAEMLQIMLDNKFDINQLDYLGCLHIQTLAAYKEYDVLPILFNLGADYQYYNERSSENYCRLSTIDILKKQSSNNEEAKILYESLLSKLHSTHNMR